MKFYSLLLIILMALSLIGLLIFLLWMNLWKESQNKELKTEQSHLTTVEKIDRHPCHWNRKCSSDVTTRLTCGYNFTLSFNFVLSKFCQKCPQNSRHCTLPSCIPLDGVQRDVAVVNGILPGPAIRVCQGDTIIVDVTNHLIGQASSIHWHGIHQLGTPWMDGVSSLTQCPIHPGATFRYEFEAPNHGTHYWHSHEGLQRADGIFGALIVRPPEDTYVKLYDFDLPEHEIIIWDWVAPLSALTRFIRNQHINERDFPTNILINGKGFPPKYFENGGPFVPIHEIRISANSSYRIRAISNGVGECPLELSIENHSIEVIASDGSDLEPIIVDSLVINAGERWDFILRGNQFPGSYWIKIRGLLDCAQDRNGAFQLAVLNYDSVPSGTMPSNLIKSWEEAGPQSHGLQLNPVNIAPGIPNKFITVAELNCSKDDDPEILRGEADHKFYISYDFNPIKKSHGFDESLESIEMANATIKDLDVEDIVEFPPQLNHITYVMPHAPPLAQPEEIDRVNKCDENSTGECTRRHCRCSHWLTVRVSSIVELILVDRGAFDTTHPFHLHGYSFHVTGMERLGNKTKASIVQKRDEDGLIERRRERAAIKDTVTVPDGGYTILRFRANNPGLWFFHCHVNFHAEEGMNLVVQVGDLHEMPKPGTDFPTCTNYIPPPRLSPRVITVH